LELGYDAEIAAQVAEASIAATGPQTDPTEVALRGTGLNSNNLALQQAAAERDEQTGQQ
jgi:hypothetical protein